MDRPAVQGDLCRGRQVKLSPVQRGNGAVARKGRVRLLHRFLREQRELELLDGVALAVAKQAQLHAR